MPGRSRRLRKAPALASRDVFALDRSGLNGFLFAGIGTEAGRSRLTVLSALARLGEDPWAKAAIGARMPKAASGEALAATIAQMPVTHEEIGRPGHGGAWFSSFRRPRFRHCGSGANWLWNLQRLRAAGSCCASRFRRPPVCAAEWREHRHDHGIQCAGRLGVTAGIDEHSAVIRSVVCDWLAWVGVVLDPAANASQPGCISSPDSSVKVWVTPTDEEAMIAHHTQGLILARE